MSKASSNRKCVTVQNASTSSGANVFQYQYNGSGNDEWYLERVGYGSAPNYSTIETSSLNINCAGFALKINEFLSGDVLGINIGDSVETVASKTITYFNTKQPNRTIRRIAGTNNLPTFTIGSNEYRVAVRVRTSETQGYDFHYILQVSDGQWAHKRGGTASDLIGYINPSTYKWPGGYNSATIYFAVSK